MTSGLGPSVEVSSASEETTPEPFLTGDEGTARCNGSGMASEKRERGREKVSGYNTGFCLNYHIVLFLFPSCAISNLFVCVRFTCLCLIYHVVVSVAFMYICVHNHVLFDLTCAFAHITVLFCFSVHHVLYLHDHVVLSRFTLV